MGAPPVSRSRSNRIRSSQAAWAMAALGALLFAPTPNAHAASPWDWLPPFQQLHQHQRDAEAQLLLTPPAQPVQFGPRVGWHSSYAPSPDRTEWVELDFTRDVSLDLLALVPVPPHSENLTPGAGFPLRFKVEAFTSQAPTVPKLLFDHTHKDFPNPGTLPVAIPCDRQPLSKVRITATRLSGNRGRFFFALGEVFLFDGNRNLGAQLEALGVTHIQASSSEGSRPDWGRINLVDGQSCLGVPEGTQPSPSLGFSSLGQSASKPLPEFWVSVDLGQSYPVDEIRLFPARPPAFSHSINFGFPELYRIELRDTEQDEPLHIMPSESGGYEGAQGNSCSVLLGNGQTARYITLFTIKPQVTNGSGYLSLSELEVWSGNQNVARGKPVFSSGSREKDGWSADALVDGFTSRANIVNPATWLTGLSHRRALEHRIAEIEQQRETQLSLAHKLLTTLSAGCVVAAMLYVGFDRRRQRLAREQELQTLRRRFAQDLHDDIGSNLGSIVLMSEQAQEFAEHPELLRELRSIQETAGESVEGLRQLVDAHRDGRGAFLQFEAQVHALSERALRGLSVQTTMRLPPNFDLPAPLHRQVLLCLKEIFHNIRRHARAQTVSLSLSLADHRLEIHVQDDGCGFDPNVRRPGGNGLGNLRHRAAALGGQVHFQSAPGQGTQVTLSLPLNPKRD
ncbi:MAG: hypothetical protein RLZZ244_2982 [Verrucomicrobiota bacterium]